MKKAHIILDNDYVMIVQSKEGIFYRIEKTKLEVKILSEEVVNQLKNPIIY